jgi:methionyl aminopeptidase
VRSKYNRAGEIAKQALSYAKNTIKTGKNVLEFVEDIEKYIRSKGGEPAFPVNIAINDVAAHFTPRHDGKEILKKGDVVKVDVGVHIDGYIADTACTVEIETRNFSTLIKSAEDALQVAIELVKPGISLNTVGGEIERVISEYGFKSIVNLTGHSMKQYNLHAGKAVPNVVNEKADVIEVGDILAIEPFATNGAGKVDAYGNSNIYRIIRTAPESIEKRFWLFKRKGIDKISQYFDIIKNLYKTLPFSERWAYRVDKNAPQYLQKLVRYGVINYYPILKDVKGGVVSQAEHTVVVVPEGCVIIT